MIELRVSQNNSDDVWVEKTYPDMNALRDDLAQTASDAYASEVLNNLPVDGIVWVQNGPNYVDTYELIEE